MTWIPPYAVDRCRERLEQRFGQLGMRDALTHLGLQFWQPTEEGGLVRVGKTNETSDVVVREIAAWGREHGVRVLLCVYNAVGEWDWSLAQAGFAEHPQRFADALMAEVERLGLEGVDLDLEGTGNQESDKEVFATFVRELSRRLHAGGKHLTLDTFAYHWHAPNQTWWPDLLPWVDALTSMGYAEIGAKSVGWRAYAAQKEAAGAWAHKLMIGMPSAHGEWQGSPAMTHLSWVADDDVVGVSFWDAQLRGEIWRSEEVWELLRGIRGDVKGHLNNGESE